MSNWFANIFGGKDECCCHHCDKDNCCHDKKPEAAEVKKTEDKPVENTDQIK